MRKWYNIINKSDRSEVWIYEQIGEDYWDGSGITAKGFQKELSAIKSSQIDLHINSPGGQVFDGITIHNLIKQHPANVTTYIDGLAASIASVIALAGDRVVMAENALFMIHKASGMVFGNSDDMRDFAEKLDMVNGSIATTYMSKTGKKEPEINDLMGAETWMTAKAALEAGFVDEISGSADMSACSRFIPVMQKANFQHIPDDIAAKREKLDARSLERILRDGGCSNTLAKSIISNGFKGEQCEAAPNAEQCETAVVIPIEKKKDRIADLLIRAEIMAPTKTL
jgi:ATP-dependent protease ClpP protease subunit